MSRLALLSFRFGACYYGWWLVFASAVIVFISAGTFYYGFGLLVSPLENEFGWSRTSIAVAFSLRTEVGGIAAIAVGFAVDHIGGRRLLMTGILFVAAGFFLLSQVHSLHAFYFAVVIIAIGNSGSGGQVASAVIAHWFRIYRGRALGLMTLGGGASGVSAVLFAVLISEFGWRGALVACGVATLAICMPLAYSFRNRPADMGLPVDGVIDDSIADGSAAIKDNEGLGSSEALRSSAFWRLALAYSLSNFATTALIVHQVPFLEEVVGTSSAIAASSITAMTLLSILGRIGFGYAADVWSKQAITAIALFAVGASIALFSMMSDVWQLIFVLPLFAIGFGGIIPLRSALIADYFGLRAFGAIQGMIFTISTIGAFIGPVLTARFTTQAPTIATPSPSQRSRPCWRYP